MGEQKLSNVFVLIGVLLYFMQRLVRIEDVLVKNTEATERTEAKVTEQNHRIATLETWKYQILGGFALIIFAAPFVFWALGFIHTGGG